ncbi:MULTISPECIES: hypothetical protein [Pantoea]|uniref:hypothetical protein n=1 Tax=Pantoea TaxID=53335 RepID=UPI001EFD6619|nr:MULTISPECIES: hypothetical protein [Pantoea]
MDTEQQQTTSDKEISLNKESVPEGLSGWLVLIVFHLIVMATVYGVSLLALFYRPGYILILSTRLRKCSL